MTNKRWEVLAANPSVAMSLNEEYGISNILAQVISARGYTMDSLDFFLLPVEALARPTLSQSFEAMGSAVRILAEAIANQRKIGICGDYDTDGMTSTSLLIRTLRFLGADVWYLIPDRLTEGYGLNQSMVEKLFHEGTKVLITVDNGIGAHDAIMSAKAMGMDVIITDHHEMPDQLPPADAILSPKLLPAGHYYADLSGVGMAYGLAYSLARHLGKSKEILPEINELLVLGTIADMVPLRGVNRHAVKRNLPLLSESSILGVRSLIAQSGGVPLGGFSVQDCGFRLSPRINAVGRIGNPDTVIRLLTTYRIDEASEMAAECERCNRERRKLVTTSLEEANALCQGLSFDPNYSRVLCLVRDSWHPGIVGLMASRLMECYGVPAFVASEKNGLIKGSARSIEGSGFNVSEALKECSDLLVKSGGHAMAGGFTIKSEHWDAFQGRLKEIAIREIAPDQVGVTNLYIDAEVALNDLSLDLWKEIQRYLEPCGVGNPVPIFLSKEVRIASQARMGSDSKHLRFDLTQDNFNCYQGVAWGWGDRYPLPETVDIVYRLMKNVWKGNEKIQLDILDVRPS